MTQKFVRTIKLFGKVSSQRILTVKRKVAATAYDEVIRRSPVRTGRFRGSWRIGLGEADLSVDPVDKNRKTRYQNGLPPSGEEKDQLVKLKGAMLTGSIHVSNNILYGARLENGWSDQAPTGMINPTISVILAKFSLAVQAAKKEVPDAR